MIPLEQALLLLQQTIGKNLVHQDYERVCALAERYKILVTGVGHEKLLRQFIRREDDALFAQRVALTETITPAVVDSIKNPFHRVGRLDNLMKEISFEQGKDEKRTSELWEKINGYHGKESLDKYLETRFTDLNFTDPNAFIVTTFDSFNPNVEKASPYPFEVSSREAVNFNYKNNLLQWLIVKYGIIYTDKDGKELPGHSYTMYLGEYVLKYSQVDAKTVNLNEVPSFVNPKGELINFNILKDVTGQPVRLDTTRYFESADKRVFELFIYQPKASEVQAIRVGYKKDIATDGRTCVSPYHAAMGYFMKTVKSVSEMDLTMALHAFPRLIQYTDRCKGEPAKNLTCNDGKTAEGATCNACKGTGEKIHTSAQDAITLPRPRDAQEYVDLEKMVVYKSPPVELLKFQQEYIVNLKIDVVKAVYNSDVTERPTVAATATEIVVNKDEMYNTLFPFTEHYSIVWKHNVRLIADFTDNAKGLLLQYEFPKDFKLKTLSELYADLKIAKDSGASDFTLQEINRDIARKMYVDNPRAFKKYLVKESFMPFLGKSEEEVWKIILNNKCSKNTEILYTHFDSIFDDLENELAAQNPPVDFVELAYDKQWTLIKAKIEEYKKDLPADNLAIDFRDTALMPDEDTPTPVDAEMEAAAKLKGSVGGAQVITSFAEKVFTGQIDYSAAVQSIMFLFKIEEEQAKKLLGTPTKPQTAPVE